MATVARGCREVEHLIHGCPSIEECRERVRVDALKNAFTISALKDACKILNNTDVRAAYKGSLSLDEVVRDIEDLIRSLDH